MKLYTTYAEMLRMRQENLGCFMRIRWVGGSPKRGLVEGVFIRRNPLWLQIQLAIAEAF